MKSRMFLWVTGMSVVLSMAWVAWAAESKIPEEYAKKKNPVKATQQSVDAGKKLYTEKGCESCHGKTGKGDGEVAKVANAKVPDMTTKDFAKKTDQELFWIISEGSKDNPLMVGFKKEIPKEDDRWHIVNYIRSLGPKDAKKK